MQKVLSPFRGPPDRGGLGDPPHDRALHCRIGEKCRLGWQPSGIGIFLCWRAFRWRVQTRDAAPEKGTGPLNAKGPVPFSGVNEPDAEPQPRTIA